LSLLAAPAMAASSPALSLADQAFVASLAVQAGAPAPVDAAKRPAIGLKSMCTANCWNGGTVSCSGTACNAVNGACPTEPGHVTCDGNTTTCPTPCNDCGGLDCNAERAACASDCSPCPFTFSCSLVTCNVTCHCKFSSC